MHARTTTYSVTRIGLFAEKNKIYLLFYYNFFPNTPKPKGRQEPFCVFCKNRDDWAQDCKEVTVVKGRTEKIKFAPRSFLSETPSFPHKL